jgi:protein ImuB
MTIDITGAAHLFGGAEGLVTALEQRLPTLVRHWRIGMGATPESAQALARHHDLALARYGPGDDSANLLALPVAALRLDPERAQGLARAGLCTLGDLARRPRAPLAARFGADLLDRLDRILGAADRRVQTVPREPPARYRRRFAEPVAHVDQAMAALAGLARRAARDMEERATGGRRFAARLIRADGQRFDLSVETGRPLRDPGAVAGLFAERLAACSDPLDPGFGFDEVQLFVEGAEPLRARQAELIGGPRSDDELAALIARLSARFGRARIRRFRAFDTHVPEQADGSAPALDAVAGPLFEPPAPGFSGERPLTLFDPPHPVAVMAAVPDGPPIRFRWRRVLHSVTRHEGPERIAAEWWRRPAGRTAPTRDYYRVEDSEGQRFWLFRRGLYGTELAHPRWYLHGLFP